METYAFTKASYNITYVVPVRRLSAAYITPEQKQ